MRMALPHGGGESRVAVERGSRLVDRQRHHVELHVRALTLRERTARSTTHLAGADGQRSRVREQPARAHRGDPQRIAYVVVERATLAQARDRPRLVMILQVL